MHKIARARNCLTPQECILSVLLLWHGNRLPARLFDSLLWLGGLSGNPEEGVEGKKRMGILGDPLSQKTLAVLHVTVK